MTKFNFIIFPYRDYYFKKKFGSIVRDLHIIEALSSSDRVKSIFVVNRPVSVYERLLGKTFYRNKDSSKISWVDKTSYDFWGPLKRRKWLLNCYAEYEAFAPRDPECINVILDFTPLAVIDYRAIAYDFTWYDLIDNFSKHNRYDEYERGKVLEKYKNLENSADLITGVSSAALPLVSGGMVLPNGVGQTRKDFGDPCQSEPPYEFGFIGFITDKFDVDLIKKLSFLGYSVVIHGQFYDSRIKKELSRIPRVSITGKFTLAQMPSVISSFKVGLIPYVLSKLHDESPLKLYQYLYNNRPILTSVQYEVKSSAIGIYKEGNVDDINMESRRLLNIFDDPESRKNISTAIRDEDFWDCKIDGVLNEIQNRWSGENAKL